MLSICPHHQTREVTRLGQGMMITLLLLYLVQELPEWRWLLRTDSGEMTEF